MNQFPLVLDAFKVKLTVHETTEVRIITKLSGCVAIQVKNF